MAQDGGFENNAALAHGESGAFCARARGLCTAPATNLTAFMGLKTLSTFGLALSCCSSHSAARSMGCILEFDYFFFLIHFFYLSVIQCFPVMLK